MTGSNSYTLTTGADWGLASGSGTGHIVLTPGAASGEVRVGADFAVAGATGTVVVGQLSADHATVDVSSADAPVLAVAAVTAAGTATVRLGSSAVGGLFELQQSGAADQLLCLS